MHTNHRRAKPRTKKSSRTRYWPYAYSLKAYRREFWKKYRARIRDLMENERYDMFPDIIPDSILWDYW